MFIFGSDGAVAMFDSTGVPSDVVVAEGGDALVTAFDEPSGLLAMASDSHGIRVLDLATSEVESVPGNDLVAGLAFARSGELLIITRVDGSVRIWDMNREANSGVVPIGSGAKLLSPLWYDELTHSVWISTSGDLTRISLDPQRWVQRACEIVQRELTADEWDRLYLETCLRSPPAANDTSPGICLVWDARSTTSTHHGEAAADHRRDIVHTN